MQAFHGLSQCKDIGRSLRRCLVVGLLLSGAVLLQAASPPAGTDKAVTVDEDVPYTFSASDWGFTDAADVPPNVFTRIKIATLPAQGSLRVDGVAVSTGSFVTLSPVATTTWVARESVRIWVAVASSADGVKLVAAESGGLIYTSTDTGATWTGRAVARNWQAVASSADGSKLVAVEAGGMIYTSADAGVSWVARESNRNWQAVASSADGVRLVAAVRGGQLYTSTDSGGSWTARDSDRLWQSVAASADGMKLVAAVNGWQLYTSTDAGESWSAVEDTRAWTSLASSANGVKLVAAVSGGQLYTSSDSGATWTARDSARAWISVASSADGVKMVAVVNGGQIYISVNSGTSWTVRPYTKSWRAVASSADGNTLAAAERGGQLYTSVPTVPTLVFTPAANKFGTPYASFTFQVEDNGAAGSNLDLSPNTMTFNVNSVNDRPVVANPIADQFAGRGSLYSFQFPTATFTDADTGSVLTYTASKEDGSALPAWLTFTPGTRRFSGTPGNADDAVVEVRLTATDNAVPPLSVSDTFLLTLIGLPSGTNGAVTMQEEATYEFAAGDFGFTDSLDVPPNSFLGIVVSTLPSGGALKLGYREVSAGGFVPMVPVPGVIWTPQGTDLSWARIASSSDGTKLVAALQGGTIYTSADSGETWTQRENGNASKLLVSSANGARLFAVSDASVLSYLYTSQDSGVTWTPQTLAPTLISLAASEDGLRLAGVSADGKIWGSIDGGVTWSLRDESRLWLKIAGSADGTNLCAIGYLENSGTQLYTSTNAGFTWTTNSPLLNWNSVVSSADGTRLVATVNIDSVSIIYLSTNAGRSWASVNTLNFGSWRQVVSSADGMKLMATADNGELRSSIDGGRAWFAASNGNQLFSSLATSADGNKLAACVGGGRLYTSGLTFPRLTYAPNVDGAGLPYSNFTFQVRDTGVAGFDMDLTPNTLSLNVTNVNDAPYFTYAPDVSAPRAQLLNYVLSASTFVDVDAGTVLTYTATLSDGSPLPAWLTFNPATRTFTGTPSAANKGVINLRLTATDNAVPPLSAVGPLRLTVPTDYPSGTNRTMTLLEDTSYAINLSEYGFTDPLDQPPNQFTGVKITSLPLSGALTLNGQPVDVGTIISTALTPQLVWKQRSSGTFSSLTISADGTRIAGIKLGTLGGIYTCPDTTTTMLAQEITPNWRAIAASADGGQLVAAKANGGVYTSNDAGRSWQVRDSTARNWKALASSQDGTRLVGVVVDGQIYTSADAGQTWVARETDRVWRSVASSADGNRLVAVVGDYSVTAGVSAGTSGQIYTSSDGGSTWVPRESDRYWWSVASSGDGSKLVAVDYGYGTGGYIYTSTDYGVSWTPRASQAGWTTVVSSVDGMRLAALEKSGTLSTSVDGGVNWTLQNITGIYSLAMNTDGSKLVVASNSGALYTSTPGPPPLIYTPAPDGNGATYAQFTFQVVDDGIGIQNVDPTPNTFTFNVTAQRDAPRLVNVVPDQVTPRNVPFSFQFRADTFLDPDGRPFTYTVTKTDGNPLPAWLSFAAGSRTFSGTPTNSDVGLVNLLLTATESPPAPLSISTNFQIAVRNETPSGQDKVITLNEDESSPLVPADFGFTDVNDQPPNQLQRVRFTTVPAAGNLFLNGVTAAAGSVFTVGTADVLPNWTPRESPRRWIAVASSADGVKLAAAEYGGPLYTSSDTGTSWTASGPAKNWSALASSTDGVRLVAGAAKQTINGIDQPAIYTSADAGQTWRPQALTTGVARLASSADGSKLFAALPSTALMPIYISRDAGVTWLPRGSNGLWAAVACSADGQHVVVASTVMYVSHDGGDLWKSVSLPSGVNGLASSSDGSRWAATLSSGSLYTSADYGETWTLRIFQNNWRSIASSADGRNLVAAGVERLYRSANWGMSWETMERSRSWSGVASSADGLKLVAGANGGQLYTSAAGTMALSYLPALNGNGSPYASFTFQVEDNGVGGASLDPTPNTITFNVVPVNDPPYAIAKKRDVNFYDNRFGQDSIAFTNYADREGNTITFSVRRQNGDTLPAWLTFNPINGFLTGTPSTSDIGDLPLQVVVTDNGAPPLSLSDPFVLHVVNLPNNPAGTNGAVTLVGDTSYTLRISDFGFTDPLDFPQNKFARVWLTTLPGNGSLTHNGVPAATGEVVYMSNAETGSYWTPRESSRYWRSVTSSADGTKLAAVVNGGLIYTSTNSGVTWTPRAATGEWYSIASSADGVYLAAVQQPGDIFTSADSGVTWIPHPSSLYWRAIASSADGSKLVAVVYSGQIYTSADFGNTWTAREMVRNWYHVASSDDGNRLVAVNQGGFIYTSADAGVTWGPHETARTWRHVASSADGSKLAAVVQDSGKIYTSTDFGLTWVPREQDRNWNSITSSADGTKLCAVVTDGLVYISTDSGVTWSPHESARSWRTTASSADGSKLVAIVSGGQIYTSTAFQADDLVFTPTPGQSGAPYTSCAFQVEDDGPMGSNRDITSNILTFNVTAPTPFQAWAIANGLPIDPSANGGANLINFAFGLNANGSNTGEIIVVGGVITQRGGPTTSTASTPNGVDFKAVFGRRKNAGLTYVVQFSADLQSWENSTATPAVIADDGEMEACTVPYPFFLSDGRKAQFFRVSISL